MNHLKLIELAKRHGRARKGDLFGYDLIFKPAELDALIAEVVEAALKEQR